MKRYAKQTALALAMALTVTSVAPATASAAAKPKYSKTYSTVKKSKNYVYTVKNIKKGTKVKWTITGTGKSCVSFSKTKAVYTESTTAGKKSTHSSNRIFIRKNKSSVVKVNIKATVTGTNGKKYTVSDKIAIAKGATATTTPATETPSTAPETTATVAPSEVPGTSATPAPSEVPGTSATPTPSGAPATSETPATTATTAPSGAPATSETPAPSGAPATSATPAPTATVAPVTAGAVAVVNNHIKIGEYDNVVLVNQNALVTVTVRDENLVPVANKAVVFSVNNTQLKNKDADEAGFEVKGSSFATTDSNGQVSFVVGPKKSSLTPTDSDYIGSVSFEANVVGMDTGSAKGTIGFSAITLGANAYDSVDLTEASWNNLVPGTNADAKGAWPVGYTSSLDKKGVVYVTSQQVSDAAKTAKEHELSFEVQPKLELPIGLGAADTKSKYFEQTVENGKSDKYTTYSTGKEKGQYTEIELKVPASQLQYATLNFDSIQLSKYTTLKITSLDAAGVAVEDPVYINGEKEQSSFGYQIPLQENAVKKIRVELLSAGQVQTDKNAGYSIKNITGVYNEAGQQGALVTLDNAKINWTAVTPIYSEDKILTNEDAQKLSINNAALTIAGSDNTYSYSYKYSVPVFPYTGNAVIREYDSNGKVSGYYLAPTYKSSVSGKENTNVLNLSSVAYEATEEEALSRVGEVTQATNGHVVTVNSTKVGSTTLEGTLSIEGLGGSELDATNSKIYTSVHWNPIPNGAKISESDAFLALAGQKISVYAQITDKNGNPVNVKDKEISYSCNGGEKFDKAAADAKGIAIVKKDDKTDVSGRATLVLSAPTVTLLKGLEAKTTDDNYNVQLIIKDDTNKTLSADLYWVNAGLTYANATQEYATENKVQVVSATAIDTRVTIPKEADSKPDVGTPWLFAVQTVAQKVANQGKLADYEQVVIDGLNVNMISAGDNQGKYTLSKDGTALASSEIVNRDVISAKIDESSVSSSKVVFKLIDTDGKLETKEFVGVGEGSTNVNARIDLGIDWQPVGAGISIITPAGNTVAKTTTGGSVDLYVRAVDGTGKNVLAGREVTFSSNVANDKFKDGDTVSTDNKITVTTDKYGVAKVTLVTDKDNKASVVSAEVKSIESVASTIINWADSTYDFGVVSAKISSDDSKVVELRFNKEVNAQSVKPGEFLLYNIVDGKRVPYEVKSATASDNLVKLTLGDKLTAGEYTIEIGDVKDAGIEYNLTDTFGTELTYDTVTLHSTKNASITSLDYDDNKDGTITVTAEKIVDPSDAAKINKDKLVVTVNGEIQTPEITVEGTNATFNLTAGEGAIVRVYYIGTVEGFTVK